MCSSNGNCGKVNRSRGNSSGGNGDSNEVLTKGLIAGIEVAVNWH